MKKRGKKPEGGASWQDTYGDMVTLLLCFFVLLYSISSVDQAKWENLVKSLNPEAEKELSQIVTENVPEGEQDVPGGSDLEVSAEQKKIDEQFDAIYDNLQDLKAMAGDSVDIEIAQGDGYTFITFRDKVFFDGDSSVLRPEGGEVIDKFAAAIAPSAEAIKQIQILGHTSQGTPDTPNDVTTDRMLSAVRSAVVAAYLQEKNVIDPSKLISSGYGQFHPIASFDTSEDRAKNRRVEMLITKTGDIERSLAEYYEQVYGTGAATQ